ncbi:MarR family winged helix-turn-helix transcriptional regulator [Streptomyces sp. NBC_01803]|uniref:MarR family winged helix-turn-helix transcriptional regulator n=1 Tax=Streptomyces sp. NBC_01803 TaxID=2975946 RepID=UPI002DD7A148|nr:MarR family transcriptional regulator [Streptomyces sp. NBC_01803]WSA46118.1 MarR family transcriptional regulator [Streptomyces sp. NBC_01803]
MKDLVDELIAAWRAELPDVLGPAAELIKRVTVLAGELAAATRSVLPEFGLTPAEFDVLVALRRSGAPYRLRPSELSSALLLSTGGTSNIVNRLTARALVRREADPADGRGTRIRLTAEGRRLAEAAVRANSAAHEKLFADLPPELVRTATQALRDVSAPR